MHKKICYIILICIAALSGCGNQTYLMTEVQLTESVCDLVDDNSTETELETTEQRVSEIVVYVCGAVENPGVYHLSSNALGVDALEAAGGFLENANRDYVNLATSIYDGQKIYFPFEEEVSDILFINNNFDDGDNGFGDITSSTNSKVNINIATKEELMNLTGIGEVRAEAIIEYREEHGSFGQISDICKVDGIKEAIYDKIKDTITVN